MTPTQKLEDLIEQIKFAMLTTTEPDGALRSRPMTTLDAKDEGVLWFFVGAAGYKNAEQPIRVNLSYADSHSSSYVSIAGTAQLLRDSVKAKELWNPLHKAWFPQGVDDPELRLLKVTIDHAEYWDAPSGKMIQFLKIAKAAATGSGYIPSPGEHERIR